MKYLLTLIFLSTTLLINAQEILESDKIYFTQYNAENNSLSVNDIDIDSNNRIVIATDKILFSINSVGDLPKKLLDNTYITSIAIDEASNIYAAGKNLIYNIKKDENFYLPDTSLNISDIDVHNEKIWVGTNKGLYRFDLVSNGWDEFNTRNSKLKSNIIYFVQSDQHDKIWIGTDNGYIKISGDKWEHEEKGKSVYASRGNNEGQWMVSENDMWLIDPYNRKYNVGLEDNMHQGKVNDFVIDSKGRIYMASDILVRYDPYEEKIEQYGADAGVLSEKCLALASDKNDNIWLGTADAGLFQMTFDKEGPEALTVSILLENKLLCNGSDNASFIISTSGGVKPYEFRWSDGSSETERRTGLGAGVYSLTVEDAAGELTKSSIEITEPEPIGIEILEVKNVSESGRKDGAIYADATGGYGTLQYKWSTGDAGKTLKNVDHGAYILTVKDQNNCAAKKQIVIGDAKNIPDLDKNNVEVGKILTINNLNFRADSSNIMIENYVVLDEIYHFLKKNPSVSVEIGGHTNTIPPHEYCDRLSTNRAKSVANYIIAKGIPARRVQYKGYGKRKPLIDSRSLKARKKNQRVEIKILEI